MNEELEKKLKKFAEERADEVYDIDIQELRQLVIDGANWMLKNLNEIKRNESWEKYF